MRPTLISDVRIEGDIAVIDIYKNRKKVGVAITDKKFFTLVIGKHWRLSTRGYVVCGRNSSLKMHYLIYGPKVLPEIDHKNRNKLDNRVCNLREATRQQNVWNGTMRKDNKSGIPGVRWHKQFKKWHSYIRVNRKRISLGCYNSLFEAVCSRKSAEKKYFKEFAPISSSNGR